MSDTDSSDDIPATGIEAILDELARDVHNLAPGDIGSIDRLFRVIEKARVAIEAKQRVDRQKLITAVKGLQGKEVIDEFQDGYNNALDAVIALLEGEA